MARERHRLRNAISPLSFACAATLIVAPVAGLRASRSGVSFSLNLPKPGMDVSAPDVAAVVMAEKTASTIALPGALVRLCSAAILSAISLVVVI
jgi:hypothetical protein